MKPTIIASAILLVFGAGQVIAACPTTGVLTGNAISTLVTLKYGCATRGTEKWNELHQGTGVPGPDPVIDFKKGPGDPVDPQKQVGTFSISGGANPGTITYNYGTGGTYTYSLTPVGASAPNFFNFCNISTFELIPVVIVPTNCLP